MSTLRHSLWIQLCGLWVFAAQAHASLLTYYGIAGEAAWLTRIGGSGAVTDTEDFNSFTRDVLIEGRSFDVGAFTITASGNGNTTFNRIDVPPYESSQANQDGTPSFYGLHNVTLDFAENLSAFALGFLDSGSPIQAYDIRVDFTDGSSQIIQFGVPRSAEFRGLATTEGQLIDSISWLRSGVATSPFSIDNTRLVAARVPEPAMLALFGLSLAALGFARSRRPGTGRFAATNPAKTCESNTQ